MSRPQNIDRTDYNYPHQCFGMGGILLAVHALIANRRAKAMADTAKAQAAQPSGRLANVVLASCARDAIRVHMAAGKPNCHIETCGPKMATIEEFTATENERLENLNAGGSGRVSWSEPPRQGDLICLI